MSETGNTELRNLVSRLSAKLEERVGRITLNLGVVGYNDLDDLSSLTGNTRCALEDADADFGYESTEDAKESLEELTQSIIEIQSEMLDRELTEDDADEDIVMEFMEEKVAELEEIIKGFGRAA